MLVKAFMDVLTFRNAGIRKKLMITSKHVMKFYSMSLINIYPAVDLDFKTAIKEYQQCS